MIQVRRRLLFNYGNFESHEIEVTLTDIPEGTPPHEIAEKLDDLMAPDLERAELATGRDNDDTALYTWESLVGLKKEDASA